MTIHYKVWLEIEEIDEDRNHYQTVGTPGGSLATFATHEDACKFVNHASELLGSADCCWATGNSSRTPKRPIRDSVKL